MEEKILEVLKVARNNGLTKQQVYKKIGYTNLSFEHFDEVFKDMQNKHLIYQTGKETYTRNPFFEGEAIVTKRGDLLVKCEEGTIKIAKNTLNCLNGDTVKIRITDFNTQTGTLKEIIKRKSLTAELITEKGTRYAVTKKGDKFKINVNKNIVDGTIIGIRLQADKKTNNQYAVLDTIIGHKNEPRNDDKAILYENEFNHEWSEKIKKEVETIPDEVAEKDKQGRHDLRNKEIFTIDGDDTKDIDDAISLEMTVDGNYILGVHIADVTHYVKEGTEIDKEAFQRATSVYMNTVVNPMYPIELSNGICSLNPEVDRLALSCVMTISPKGKVLNFDIFESVIKSRKQMTYKNVNKILEENEIPEGYEEYADTLIEMNKLANILKNMRKTRGYQDFDRPEIKVITDDKGNPTEISSRTQRSGEELIEQFMLIANETVATYINSMKVPSIYRVHDLPDEERVRKTVTLIRNYQDTLEMKNKKVNSKYIQEMLEKINNMTRKDVYSNLIMRSLAKATYEAYNIGHFSIGIDSDKREAYTHFTSPIRRYPDTTIHRTLKTIIHGNIEQLYNDSNKQKQIQIAKHSSVQERNADKCEKESNKMKTAEYMQNHIDEEYEGTIIEFSHSGMFVSLSNLIEGRVGYETMDDYYDYDEENELLIGERTKQIYRLGDKVMVTVTKADKNLRQIDFELSESKSRKNKDTNKTRKRTYNGNTK